MAVRAAQLVPLTDLVGEGQVIMPDFWAVIDNERVFVTAVLERTVVYIHGPERKLARRGNCYVDPSAVEIRTSSNPLSWRSRGRGAVAAVKVVTAEPAIAVVADDEELEVVDIEDEELDLPDAEEDEDEEAAL